MKKLHIASLIYRKTIFPWGIPNSGIDEADKV